MDDANLIRLDLPATHQHLNIVSACVAAVLERLDELENATEVVYGIQLAVQEVCANIVEHAYRGAPDGRIQVLVRLDMPARELAVELRDTASHVFNPDETPEPDLANPQSRGYGLFLARSLMDEVTYHACPGNNRWHLSKRLGALARQSQ